MTQNIILTFFLSAVLMFHPPEMKAQTGKTNIPQVLHGIVDHDGSPVFHAPDGTLWKEVSGARITLEKASGQPSGSEKGIRLDFADTALNGLIYFGLINYHDGLYPQPVYRSSPAIIIKGKANINMDVVRGVYDMTGWEEKGYGTLGYRVINDKGIILYDGKVSFSGTGPFSVENTVTEGPFVQNITPSSAVIWFNTSKPDICSVQVNGKKVSDSKPATHHEMIIDGLNPQTQYSYEVICGMEHRQYTFKTAPADGTRQPFVFAYASDSRGGAGWGERNIYGANGYIVKKILAVAADRDVAFIQFTGDLISGYRTVRGEMELQYHNWKSVVEPFAHYFPVYVGMGNHESFDRAFSNGGPGRPLSVDRFPYATASAEHLFASEFVNPVNGPVSEDMAEYDPNPAGTDFPPYKETSFWYRYDNVAVISLNSDYWYTPSAASIPVTGGNLHGYIMDNQLAWLGQLLASFEKDPTLDHVFITVHTPFFPNSAHTDDDMWYGGNNELRPWVAGKPVKKGIIERRDQLLDLSVNKSTKVVALLTGDEHNYCKTEIGPETPRYPENYNARKISLSRTIWQINNGAAGAPYYAQVKVPWSDFTSGFTTQNAVCLFYVNGKSVKMVVINPDTMEKVDSLVIR